MGEHIYHTTRRRLCAILFAACCICFAQPLLAADHAKPYLLHLPGIGGHRPIDDLLTAGIEKGGLDASVEIYDWTENNPGLTALTSFNQNHHEAEIIAQRITKIYRADPSRRIIVSGHSGGAGVAIWALEKLPDDVHIDTLVMLAAALSPQYDLSAALHHVSGKAYAFDSAPGSDFGFWNTKFRHDRSRLHRCRRQGRLRNAAHRRPPAIRQARQFPIQRRLDSLRQPRRPHRLDDAAVRAKYYFPIADDRPIANYRAADDTSKLIKKFCHRFTPMHTD